MKLTYSLGLKLKVRLSPLKAPCGEEEGIGSFNRYINCFSFAKAKRLYEKKLSNARGERQK